MKTFFAALLLAISFSANALYLEPYPINGEDCTAENWKVSLINRKFIFMTDPASGISKILDVLPTTKINYNDGAVFKVGATITVNGIAQDFTCQASELEVFQ